VVEISQKWYLEYAKYHSFNNTVMPGEINKGTYRCNPANYYLTADELIQVKADTLAYLEHRDVSSAGLWYNGRRAGKKFRCSFERKYEAEQFIKQIENLEHTRFGKIYGNLAFSIHYDFGDNIEHRGRLMGFPTLGIQLMHDALADESVRTE
jgi:hypothetical protein